MWVKTGPAGHTGRHLSSGQGGGDGEGAQADKGREATELEVAMSLFVWELEAMCSSLFESCWQEFQEPRGVSL